MAARPAHPSRRNLESGQPMAVVLVAGTHPEAGATTVAAALAHRLAYAGHTVRLERLAGDDRAAADALAFATFEVADASGEPVEAGAIRDASGAVTLVEAPAGAGAAALANQLGARLVLVAREGDTSAAAEAADGMLFLTHALREAPRQFVEDRTLAAPTVGRLIDASRSQVLTWGDDARDATCDHIVVGAISHDPDVAYFRRFPRACIVTRAERVDIALAAMSTAPPLLILTGGGEPSPYIIDRVAAASETTLALAPEGTVETVRDIEGQFGRDPFAGEAKFERAGALAADAIDDATLQALLGR
ncbi:MAG: hypothetical protein GEU80_08215 [Dehalococcoidia bacterium]|nr:hypothetical protein [Dehalococcoidia bacterium]